MDLTSTPIFIVGCGRSGTTMLRLMFDAHPDVAIPGESHFIIPKYRSRSRYTSGGNLNTEMLLSDIMATEHFRRWGLAKEKVFARAASNPVATFAEAIALLFESYALSHGKPRWGDKTPIYVRSIGLLAELFPTAQFIHIIRDGRDVALSYLGVPWGPESIWQVAREWKIEVSAGRRAGGRLGPSRYTEVRYENLVDSPKDELQRLCQYAHLRFDDSMLDFHLKASERLGPTSHDQFHSSVTKAVSGPLRDWTVQMEEKDVMAFEVVAGSLLAELGYPARYEQAPLSSRLSGAFQQIGIGGHVAASRLKRSLRLRFGKPSAVSESHTRAS